MPLSSRINTANSEPKSKRTKLAKPKAAKASSSNLNNVTTSSTENDESLALSTKALEIDAGKSLSNGVHKEKEHDEELKTKNVKEAKHGYIYYNSILKSARLLN